MRPSHWVGWKLPQTSELQSLIIEQQSTAVTGPKAQEIQRKLPRDTRTNTLACQVRGQFRVYSSNFTTWLETCSYEAEAHASNLACTDGQRSTTHISIYMTPYL
eukprot:3193117-Amphidinium_carterae.1